MEPLHTIDINEDTLLYADKYFKNLNIPIKSLNTLVIIDIIPSISEKVQLVFIDADKEKLQ